MTGGHRTASDYGPKVLGPAMFRRRLLDRFADRSAYS